MKNLHNAIVVLTTLGFFGFLIAWVAGVDRTIVCPGFLIVSLISFANYFSMKEKSHV